ncbi:MAG TPA: hypothetical protein VFN87_19240, partial [Solirubrobacteraceae bacterium]|nr:hypothetical protein [Solirubrobacteraceae bacterium]
MNVKSTYTPAFAGASGSGVGRSPGFGVLGSRRNRFWFGVIGLLVMLLPYASLGTASIKAMLNPATVLEPLPYVGLPAARFPVLAVPKGVRGARGGQPRAGLVAHTPSPTTAAPGTRRITRTPGTRRLVHRGVARRGPGRRIPVQQSTYSLAAAPVSHAPGTGSAAVSGLAHAISGAPVVVNTQPPPPLPTPPPPTVVPAPSAPAGAAAPTPTVSVNVSQGHLRRARATIAAAQATADATSNTTSAASTQTASGTTATPTPAPDTPAAPATDTTAPPAPAAASDTTATPASDTTATPATDTTATPATDTTATPATDTTATPATDTTTAPAPAAQIQAGEPSSPSGSSDTSSVAPQQASVAPASSSSSDPASSDTGAPAAPAGSSPGTSGPNPDPAASVTPQAAPVPAGDAAAGDAPGSVGAVSGDTGIAYAGTEGVGDTIAVPVVAATVSVTGVPTTVAAGSTATELPGAAGPVVSTTGLVPAAGATDLATTGSIAGAPGQTTLAGATWLAGPGAPSAGSGSDSPALSPAVLTAAGAAAPPAGAPEANQLTTTTPPVSGADAPLAANQIPASSPAGTLGARGPPAVYGPVLISAAQGGSITAGNATLTFAPGALPHDAEVTVSVSSVSVPGLSALSQAYDLRAVDTATGALIEHFAVAPQLTIGVGAGATSPSIYYLAPSGGPVAIASAYDASTGTVTAGLPHFSTYVAASTVSDLFGFIQTELGQYVSGVLSGTTTIAAPNDLSIGGVVELGAPSVTFSNISWTGSGTGALFTGTITVSSSGGGIATGVINATVGQITGTYTLAAQTATAGTLTVTLANPSITVQNFVTVTAATLKLTYGDDGTTKQTALGATGISAVLTAGSGPSLTLANGSLGLVARTPDAAGTTTYALLAAGDVSLSAATGLTLTGTGWSAAYDAFGDLSAAPITVDTGSGTVLLNMAQPTGVTGAWSTMSGTAALAVGALGTLTGQFAATVSGSSFSIVASGVSSQIAAGSAAVTLTGASGTLTVTSGGANGNAAGAVRLSGVPALTLAANLTLSFDTSTSSFAIAGTGSLEVPAFLDLTGTLNFSRSGAQILANVQGSAGTAQLQINADGTFAATGTIDGALPAVVAGLSLSGSLSVSINTSTSPAVFTTPAATVPASTFTLTGTPKLVTPLGDLTGSFTFTRDLVSRADTIDVTSAQLFLGQRGASAAQDVGVQLSGSVAHLVIEANGTYAFRVEGTASVANVSSLAFTGTFRAQANTTGADVTLPDEAAGAPAPVTAGSASLTGANTTLAVGGFSLAGNFSVARSPGTGAASSTELLVGATGVNASIGGSGTQLTVANAGFGLVVEADHSYALQASGQGALTGISGVTLSGLLGVQRNTESTAVARQIQVGSGAYTIDVPAGPAFSQFGGQGITIAVLGQTLTGDLQVTTSGTGVSITLANAAASLGNGLATVSGASGTLTADPTSGTSASFSASALVLSVPGITAAGSVSGSIAVPASGTGGHFTLTVTNGSNPVLAVGPASLTGSFSFAGGAGGVTITTSDAGLSFGSYVTVSGGSGSLALSSAGVVADLSATTVSVSLPGFAPSGMTATIQVNTTSAPTTAADGAVLPAGPFIQAAVTVPQTTVYDPAHPATVMGQLAGNFLFEQQQVNGTTTTIVGLSGVSAWIGSASSATVTNGEGLFIISSAGLAGYISGTAQAGGTGFAAGGNVIVQFNTTGAAVNATVTLGGRQLTVDYGSGQSDFFSVSISDLTIQIGQAIWLSGNVSLTTGVTVSGMTGSTFAGSGLTVFFGNGPGLLANGDVNPLAVGLLISNASVVLFKDDATGKYALDASGTVSLVGVPNATVGGTGRVRINPFTQAINATVALPGSGTSLPLVFLAPGEAATSATAPFVSAGGLGLSLNLYGQAIGGDLSLTDSAGVITVGIANASVSLSDGSGNVSSRGPPLASVTNGSGQLQISPSGVVGGLTGTVAVTLPGASVTGTFSVLVNTTGAAPSGPINGQSIPAGTFFELTASGASITIGGQSLSGTLTLARSTSQGVTTTTLTVAGGGLSIGDGTTTFLALDQIAGSLTVSSAGIAGSLSAHVNTSALPGLTVGTISVAVNTTSAAVNGLPAGPYLRGELTGASLTVAGQTVSGDFGFQRTTDATNATVVIAAITNLTAVLGGGVATLSNGTGIVVASSAGLAGSVGGTLTLNVPGITLAGTLNLQVNQTTARVTDSLTVAGTPIGIDVPAGPAISVAGTGITITALGQSISGDVTLTSASGTTSLTLANGALSLAGGAVTVSGAAGQLTIDAGGVSGNLDATVTSTLSALSFSSGLQLAIDTHPATA